MYRVAVDANTGEALRRCGLDQPHDVLFRQARSVDIDRVAPFDVPAMAGTAHLGIVLGGTGGRDHRQLRAKRALHHFPAVEHADVEPFDVHPRRGNGRQRRGTAGRRHPFDHRAVHLAHGRRQFRFVMPRLHPLVGQRRATAGRHGDHRRSHVPLVAVGQHVERRADVARVLFGVGEVGSAELLVARQRGVAQAIGHLAGKGRVEHDRLPAGAGGDCSSEIPAAHVLRDRDIAQHVIGPEGEIELRPVPVEHRIGAAQILLAQPVAFGLRHHAQVLGDGDRALDVLPGLLAHRVAHRRIGDQIRGSVERTFEVGAILALFELSPLISDRVDKSGLPDRHIVEPLAACHRVADQRRRFGLERVGALRRAIGEGAPIRVALESILQGKRARHPFRLGLRQLRGRLPLPVKVCPLRQRPAQARATGCNGVDAFDQARRICDCDIAAWTKRAGARYSLGAR